MTRPSRWQRQCVTNFSFMEQLHRRHHNSKAFSCYVIGQEVLPCLECIQILLDRDCKIYGFISLDNELRQWSVKQNIPFLGINYDRSSDRYLIEFLSQHSFDYLFSIENYYLLNEDVLKLPRKGAVNYHNSLLPRYAGCEVEHWAIANREKTHGITWHFMSKQVDAGDIIKQVFFEVSPIETAFSLNEKSDRAAVKSFSQLIDELATNRVSRVKQNLEERTYYAFSKRPPVGCVFSWNLCADEIDTFIRSLTYSCNRNYVGTPKIAIDNKFLIVPKIRILNFKSGVPAGTIVKIELKSIQIATQTNDVILTEILTIEGNKLPLTKAVSQFSWFEGYQFIELNKIVSERLTKSYVPALKQEYLFWVDRLATVQPTSLASFDFWGFNENSTEYAIGNVALSNRALSHLQYLLAKDDCYYFLLAVFCCFLYFFMQKRSIEIGYGDRKIKEEFQELEGFFVLHTPLRIQLRRQMTFREVLLRVKKEVEATRQRKTYCRDIFVRNPTLRRTGQKKCQFSTVVEQVKNLDNLDLRSNADFTLFIPENAEGYAWRYVKGFLDSKIETEMSHWLTSIANKAVRDLDRDISQITRF